MILFTIHYNHVKLTINHFMQCFSIGSNWLPKNSTVYLSRMKTSTTTNSFKLLIYLKMAKEDLCSPIFCFLEVSRTLAGMCWQCLRGPHWIQTAQTVWQKHDLWLESEQAGPPDLPHTLWPAELYPFPLPLQLWFWSAPCSVHSLATPIEDNRHVLKWWLLYIILGIEIVILRYNKNRM